MRNECSAPGFAEISPEISPDAAATPSHPLRRAVPFEAPGPRGPKSLQIMQLKASLTSVPSSSRSPKPEAEELAKEDLLKREAEETAVGGATSAIGISFVLDIFCCRAWHDRVN